MPFDPSIPLQAKAPSFDDAMKPISSMLNIQNASQELQSRSIQNQANQALLQERNNVRQLFQNPQQFMDDSGNIDFNKAAPAIMSAAPTQGGQIISGLVSAQKSSIDAKKAMNDLGDAQRASVGQYVMAQADLPPEQVFKNLDGLAQLQPGLTPAINHLKQYILTPASNDPKAFKTAVLKAGQAAMAPASQATAIQPNGPVISNGQTTQQFNDNPIAGPIGPVQGVSVKNQIAPIQQEGIESDSLGNRYIVQRSPSGAILNTRPVPGNYNPTAGTTPGTGPASLPPGYDPDSLKAEIAAARTSANQAPILHDINRTIIDKIDKGVTTGMAGGVLATAKNAFGSATPSWFPGSDWASSGASDYDILGKMLERSALTAAHGMGPQTNAGLEANIRANGSKGYMPQTLRNIASLNDALVTGSERYNQGLRAATTSAGGNAFVKNQFDQDWANNFDPRITRLQNATERGDQKEINNVLTELGVKNPNDQREIANNKAVQGLLGKVRNLDKLTSQGHL